MTACMRDQHAIIAGVVSVFVFQRDAVAVEISLFKMGALNYFRFKVCSFPSVCFSLEYISGIEDERLSSGTDHMCIQVI